MDGRRISIIVPVGPIHRWLPEAVRSITEQQLPQGWALEVVIAVDGVVNSLAAARALPRDERLGIAMVPSPVGPYAVLNAALPYTRGELIGKSDADDVMLPGRLAAIVGAFAPAVDLVNTLHASADEHLQKLHPRGVEPEGVWVFRRSLLLERLGGWRAWPCGADTDLLLRASALGARRATVGRSLYVARQHGGSLTRAAATGAGSEQRAVVTQQLAEDHRIYSEGGRPVVVMPYDGPVVVEGPLFDGRS